MRLHPEPFEELKSGTKKTEARLNDEKRKKIKVGDTIRFIKRPDLKKSITVKVKGIKHLSKFKGLDYYSEDKKKKYGFVIFDIELL